MRPDAPSDFRHDPGGSVKTDVTGRPVEGVRRDEAVGLEYYSLLGPVTGFDARSHQLHQLFATGTTELPSRVEASLGIGRGLTRNSDRWVVATRLELKF